MIDKIYVLVAYGGEYEDRWRTNIAASLDLGPIERLKTEKELHRSVCKAWEEKRDAFSDQWLAENRVPLLGDLPVQESWPSFVGSTEITAEMQETWQRINDENDARMTEYFKPLAEYRAKYRDVLEHFCIENGWGVDDIGNCETNYMIDEVEMV